MQLFKFRNPTNDTLMEQGEYINGVTDIMWVERYRDSGEVTLKSPVSENIKALLPTGTLIGHTESTDIMIIENHEIADDADGNTELVTTGRTFETFLENRIVGTNKTFPSQVSEYSLAAGKTWDQAVALIAAHITTATDTNDRLSNVTAITAVTGAGDSEIRIIERIPLYQAVNDILAVDTLGVRTVRPGPWSPLGAASVNTAIEVYRGADRSATVIFSYDAGDIDSGNYLWSIKSLKNSILVKGKWVEVMIKPTATRYDRRVMVVDAAFIDEDYAAYPAGAALTAVVAAMNTYGKQVLAATKEKAIANVDISKDVRDHAYRHDFNLGDIVTVAGDYDEVRKMRVIEFVEIEDATGESSYPTLDTL